MFCDIQRDHPAGDLTRVFTVPGQVSAKLGDNRKCNIGACYDEINAFQASIFCQIVKPCSSFQMNQTSRKVCSFIVRRWRNFDFGPYH